MKPHLFFFSEQVVNMASIYIMFNIRRILLGIFHQVSECLAPCKAGRTPLESGGSSCRWRRVRAEPGLGSMCDTVSQWQNVLLSWRHHFSLQIMSFYGGFSPWAWNGARNLKVNLLSQHSYVTLECGKWRQLEEEVISLWPRLFISYIYQCICTFLSTQSCTLWLSCYNTSLPAEGEAFLPLRVPPTAQSPTLPSACCYLWDQSGSRGSPVGWQHRARRGGRKGKLGQGKRCHPIPFWWFWVQLVPKP